jgi:hypothetical protein
MSAEPVFVNLLRSPGIDSQPGRYDNPIWRTGPSGNIGWRNRFLKSGGGGGGGNRTGRCYCVIMDPVYMPHILQDGKLRFILLVMLMLISAQERGGQVSRASVYFLNSVGLGETAPLLLSELCMQGLCGSQKQRLETWPSSVSCPMPISTGGESCWSMIYDLHAYCDGSLTGRLVGMFNSYTVLLRKTYSILSAVCPCLQVCQKAQIYLKDEDLRMRRNLKFKIHPPCFHLTGC